VGCASSGHIANNHRSSQEAEFAARTLFNCVRVLFGVYIVLCYMVDIKVQGSIIHYN